MITKCSRCNGLLIYNQFYKFLLLLNQHYCINCGNVVDSAILSNQRKMELAFNGIVSDGLRNRRYNYMLSWIEFLKTVSEMNQPFRNIEAVEHFNMSEGEASSRIHTLRHWGFVKYANSIKKGWGGFIVTEHGFKRVEKYLKEGK